MGCVPSRRKQEREGVKLPPCALKDPEKCRVVTLMNSVNPTQVTDVNWMCIRINSKLGKYHKKYRSTEVTGGKWLLFEIPERVDKLWAEIMVDTEFGLLGYASSVETKKSKDEQKREMPAISGHYVICVHTYNMDDEEDVNRVRERLRERGFFEKLLYTRDDVDRDALEFSDDD